MLEDSKLHTLIEALLRVHRGYPTGLRYSLVDGRMCLVSCGGSGEILGDIFSKDVGDDGTSMAKLLRSRYITDNSGCLVRAALPIEVASITHDEGVG